MKRPDFYRIITLSTCLLAVAPVKCNSILAKRNPTVDDGYDYVKVSGSMVPQRVKRGTEAVTASPEDTTNAEALRKMLLKTQGIERIKSGGG